MSRHYLIAASVLAVALLAPTAFATLAVVNDNRATAIPVAAPGAFVIDNTGATLESGESRPCGLIGSTIWYTFVAPISGVFKVRAESTPGYDTVVAVYPAGSATRLACNDDAGGILNGYSSQVSVSLTQASQYDIQVGGFFGDQGQAVLHITN